MKTSLRGSPLLSAARQENKDDQVNGLGMPFCHMG